MSIISKKFLVSSTGEKTLVEEKANIVEVLGVIDESGKEIVPMIYSTIEYCDRGYIVTKDEMSGVIDLKGNIVVDLVYDGIREIQTGYLVEKDDKTGVVDSYGKTIIEPKYQKIYEYLKDDKVIGYSVDNGPLNEGYCLLNGKEIIPPDYESVYIKSCYIRAERESGAYDLFDLNGEYLMENVDNIQEVPNLNNFLVLIKRYYKTSMNIYSIKDKKIIAEGLWEHIDVTEDGFKVYRYCRYEFERAVGLISFEGEIIIPCEYTDFSKIRMFGKTYYEAKLLDEKKGTTSCLYSGEGRLIIEPDWDYRIFDFNQFSDNMIEVRHPLRSRRYGASVINLYGLHSKDGKMLLDYEWEKIEKCGKYILVTRKKYKGLYSTDGKKLIDAKYYSIKVEDSVAYVVTKYLKHKKIIKLV